MDQCNGRMRVFVRLRPTEGNGTPPAVEHIEGTCALHVHAAPPQKGGPTDWHHAAGTDVGHEFSFDGVLTPETTQQDVYQTIGLPLLRACLGGVNGAILAYGQTGSGKTHSLLNHGKEAGEAGLLPRIVFSLFVHIAKDEKNVYDVEAAAAQVYNEQVDDLLHQGHRRGDGQNLAVQQAGELPALTWIQCEHPDEMLEAFSRARSNIIYAETKMNKVSSRSHALFQIRLTRRGRASAAQTLGGTQRMQCQRARLMVVDLAGSERVKKSGVEGLHFREAVHINKSLLVLGNVMSALALKHKHVPLRDSKLTKILEGSIGGNCRTVLLVCVSCLAVHTHETLSALEFAARAMCVEVSAEVNTGFVEVDALALLDERRRDRKLEALRRANSMNEEQARALQGRPSVAAAPKRSRIGAGLNGLTPQALRLQQAAEKAEQGGKRWQEEAERLQSQLNRVEEETREEAERLQRLVGRSELDVESWRSHCRGVEEECEHAREAAAEAAAQLENVRRHSSLAEEASASWHERVRHAEVLLEARCRDASEKAAAGEKQHCRERRRVTKTVLRSMSEIETFQEERARAVQQTESMESELADHNKKLQAQADLINDLKTELDRLRNETGSQEQQLAEASNVAGPGVRLRAGPGKAHAEDIYAEHSRGSSQHVVEAVQSNETLVASEAVQCAKHNAVSKLEEHGQRLKPVALGAEGAVAASGSRTPESKSARADESVSAEPYHHPKWTTKYVRWLGVDTISERVLFGALTAALLRGLPEGWTLHVDGKGRAYFWSRLSDESQWTHPDHEIYTAVAKLHRLSLQQQDRSEFLRLVLKKLEGQSQEEKDMWSGPYLTGSGETYWHSVQRGRSVWHDPVAEAIRRHSVRSSLVQALLNDADKQRILFKQLPSIENGRTVLQAPPPGGGDTGPVPAVFSSSVLEASQLPLTSPLRGGHGEISKRFALGSMTDHSQVRQKRYNQSPLAQVGTQIVHSRSEPVIRTQGALAFSA